MRGVQLRLDGTEVPVGEKVTQAPFTAAQREILDRLRRQGVIRPVEAGEIVHLHRHVAGKWDPRYFSSDGVDALKRLAARGLVERGEKRGEWLLAGETR